MAIERVFITKSRFENILVRELFATLMVSVLQFWCQPHEVLCKGSITTHKLLYKTNMFAFIFVWKLSRPPITNWKQIKCSLKLAWEDSGMVTRRKIDFWNFIRFILIAICVLIFCIISHELVANWLAKEVVTTQKWDRSGTPETIQPLWLQYVLRIRSEKIPFLKKCIMSKHLWNIQLMWQTLNWGMCQSHLPPQHNHPKYSKKWRIQLLL